MSWREYQEGVMSDAGFTIFLVDDDAGVLKALKRLLHASGYEVRGFSSPERFLAEHDPSVAGCAILDIAMPGLDGLVLQEKLVEREAGRPIIFLTGNGDIPMSVRAMRAGAIDFLTKPVAREALLAAVGRAAQQDAEARRRSEELSLINSRLQMLTRREREVLVQVAAGRLNKQIAADLGTVEKTIKVHRGRMMTKLGLRSVADLVRLTERIGIAPQH
jgi:FixJ family two-component response regulator